VFKRQSVRRAGAADAQCHQTSDTSGFTFLCVQHYLSPGNANQADKNGALRRAWDEIVCLHCQNDNFKYVLSVNDRTAFNTASVRGIFNLDV